VTPSNETAHLLAEGIAKLGLSRLPWGRAQNQLRDRIGFLRAAGGDEWPDRTDAGLTNTVAQWLAPFLARKTKLSEIAADDRGAALDALLPWHLKRRLEEEAPGSGSSVRNGGPARASLSVSMQRPISPANDHGRIALIVTRTRCQSRYFQPP
jgi:HrpA-like RNA helicase